MHCFIARLGVGGIIRIANLCFLPMVFLFYSDLKRIRTFVAKRREMLKIRAFWYLFWLRFDSDIWSKKWWVEPLCQIRIKFRGKFCWEGGVTKKRHGHNFDFWGLKRIARPSNMVGRTCYSFQTSKLIIVAVSFFRNASYFCWRSQNFTVVWLWPAITPVQNVIRSMSHIFGKLWTLAFTWT